MMLVNLTSLTKEEKEQYESQKRFQQEYAERYKKYSDECEPKEQQMKMTREEAVKTISRVCYFPNTDIKGNGLLAINIVDALEALGLLKFDEGEKKEDATDYVKMAKDRLKTSMGVYGSDFDIIRGLLNIIEGHVKPNVDCWTVSKGDEIKIKFEGWHKNNPQYEGRVVNIEKSPGG